MSSKRKIDSAHANGAKSHGPVTEEGRKISSMNALKHGLTAATVVLPNESAEDFQALMDAYIEQFEPQSAVELDLVVEMVNAKWRQRRLWAVEAFFFAEQMEKQTERLEELYDSYNPTVEHAFAFRTLTATGLVPSMTRVESRLERAYSRALKNLLQLQRLRKTPPHPDPPPGDDEKTSEKRTESQERTKPAPNPPDHKPLRTLTDPPPYVELEPRQESELCPVDSSKLE